MEQIDLISFTSVIAGMLLCKRVLTSSEIVNFISELNCKGMEIDDYWNNEELLLIVNMSSDYSIELKKELSYDTILKCGMSVWNFLQKNTDERVLRTIYENKNYDEMFSLNCYLSNSDSNNCQKSSLDVSNLNRVNFFPKVKKRNLFYSLWGVIH